MDDDIKPVYFMTTTDTADGLRTQAGIRIGEGQPPIYSITITEKIADEVAPILDNEQGVELYKKIRDTVLRESYDAFVTGFMLGDLGDGLSGDAS